MTKRLRISQRRNTKPQVKFTGKKKSHPKTTTTIAKRKCNNDSKGKDLEVQDDKNKHFNSEVKTQRLENFTKG